LVGFLVTEFLLNAQGITSGDMLQKLADVGITLLLFAVSLKLNLRTLARPQVQAVTGLHTALVVGLFALSFSSTVFVVKELEEKGQMRSLHGRIAIGILVMREPRRGGVSGRFCG